MDKDAEGQKRELAGSSPLQILVRQDWRSPDAMKRLARELESIGLTVTAVGLASISARASAEKVDELFGAAKAGAELPIPAALRDSVASITVASKHILMDPSAEQGGGSR